MEASAERAPLPVTIIADPLPPLPSIIEATAYFVAAEALTNAVKHAGASHVWITVHHTDAQLQVEIDDDTAVAAVDLRRTHPEIGVLVLSQHLESRYLHTLLGDNARGVGYLLKERVTGIRGFVDAVREVAAGGCVVDPEVVAVHGARSPHRRPYDRLAEREREVLVLMAQGRSNTAICAHLHLSAKTVESHVRNIFQRLDLLPAPDDHRRVLPCSRSSEHAVP